MKKILYVDLSSGFGGSSAVLHDLLKNLDRKEFQPSVLVIREGENFGKIRKLGLEVFKSDIRILLYHQRKGVNSYISAFLDLLLYLLPNVFILVKFINGHGIRCVHLNNNIKHTIDSILAARLAGVPCICHIRETKPLAKSEKFFGRFVDKFVVLNPEVYEDVSRCFGASKVLCLPDGLDTSVPADPAQQARIREEFRLAGYFCAGMLGRLVPGKGVDDFIRAAAVVKQKHARIRFLVVGNDPDRDARYQEQLRELVRTLGVEQEVIFTGWRPDPFDMIGVLDVLVQPSTMAEGFGLTCVEAMLMGKPVVATRVPGPSGIVEAGKTGHLVAPGRPEEIARAIGEYVDDPALKERTGRAGRTKALEQYDIQKNVRTLEGVYREFLK